MNSAVNFKSFVCKVWFAILMTAILQVSLLDKSHAQAAKTMALDAFVEQVRAGNEAFKGAQMTAEGASLRANEYKLLTRPVFFAGASYLDNKTETGNAIVGDRVSGYASHLGLKQITNFGLQGSLKYNLGHTLMPEANGAFIEMDYHTAGPVLELNQSLWRNGFGRETRATQQLLSAQAQATKYSNSYQQKEILAGAEVTYWRLSLAREAVEWSQDNLKRAERLRGWSSGRQRSGLGDRSDYLQANTAYLARELELKAALQEEKSAARAFNTMRGVESDVVTETLTKFDSDTIVKRMRLPDRSEMRDDVKAAEQSLKAAEAQSKIGAEKNRPLLDVFGTVSYNGREREASPAVDESWNNNPNYAVGVKLEVPLDIGTTSDNVKGYKAEARAAQIIFERRKFESDQLWKELSQNLADTLERYKIATEIEKMSKEKMEYERVRHGRGRSTTFQVLQFETDLANAQLNRLRTQFEMLNTYAKLRTFAGGSQ